MRLNAFVTCAGLLLIAGTSQAQIPGGTYMETCTNARVHNEELHARCRTMSGAMVDTSLHLPCHGSIDNIDGRLMCRGAPVTGVPGGSYLQSCSDARVENRVLYAHCRRRNQSMNWTSLPLPCPSHRIDNLDGILTCVR